LPFTELDRTFFARLAKNFAILALLVTFGTTGFILVEHWSLLDALYMTVITLATVGFDEVHPLDDTGKIYVILLILAGVGTLLYVLTDTVELLLQFNFRRRRMKEKIRKLSGHQIVCGFGRTGREVVEHFLQNKIAFIVIDSHPEICRRAEAAGVLVIEGDASQDETLLEAQVAKATGIICALPDDTTNTFIALTAKELNETIKIVCRAGQPGSEAKMRRAGAHMVISPYVICGRRMATAVTDPLVTEFLDVVMHTPAYDLRMEQVELLANSALVGTTIREANVKQESGAMILAVYQSGKLITNPPPDLVFCKGDEVIALGAQEQLKKLSLLAGARTSSRK
jgi:voltage-gated potassium channel